MIFDGLGRLGLQLPCLLSPSSYSMFIYVRCAQVAAMTQLPTQLLSLPKQPLSRAVVASAQEAVEILAEIRNDDLIPRGTRHNQRRLKDPIACPIYRYPSRVLVQVT